jgi:endonuclease G
MTQRRTLRFCLALTLAAGAIGCGAVKPLPPSEPSPTAAARSTTQPAPSNAALGMPSPANRSTASAQDYLVENAAFTLSYNRERGGPNWVSWHVDADDLGSAPRSNDFHPEPDLPQAWRIRPGDYSQTGYDRGHVCPSGDRTGSPELNTMTFSMANMLPQAANVNRGTWEKLESYCRDRVKQGDALYIVAGGYGTKSKVASGRVTVPERCWKVVVFSANGGGPSAVTADTPIVAVDMPNDDSVDQDWRRYLTTVQAIEQATSLSFFNALAPEVAAALKTKRSSERIAGDEDSAVSPRANSPRDEKPRAAGRSTASAGPVIANRRSKVYHVPGCPGYGEVGEKNRVTFASVAAAESAGYRKAGNCP